MKHIPRSAGDARQRKRTIAERRFAERAGELAELGLQERFERSYSTNLWSDPESRSGVGSGLDSTRVLRAELPMALRQLEARVLLDVPCGDFAWMEHVDLSGIEYIGGDIVPSIIEENQRLHAGESRRFARLDLTRDILPDADVLLCRDGDWRPLDFQAPPFSFPEPRLVIRRELRGGGRIVRGQIAPRLARGGPPCRAIRVEMNALAA
ncbi:MAG TPA: hypothetical protein VHE82_10645 [Gemmatimonadaceae bacterium]|nr:hypothetical protein [Gemmatimonadaceae bacterium]